MSPVWFVGLGLAASGRSWRHQAAELSAWTVAPMIKAGANWRQREFGFGPVLKVAAPRTALTLAQDNLPNVGYAHWNLGLTLGIDARFYITRSIAVLANFDWTALLWKDRLEGTWGNDARYESPTYKAAIDVGIAIFL